MPNDPHCTDTTDATGATDETDACCASGTTSKVLQVHVATDACCAQSDTQNPGEQVSPKDKSALTFEEKVELTCHLLTANPLNREMLYRILKACQNKRWLLYDLEDYVQSCPENTSATQPPYFLIKWLADAEALDVFELDAHGQIVDLDQLEGLTEDEIDDIVEDCAFETSAVGIAAVEVFSPTHRLLALLDIVPERYSTYREVLELLQERQGLDKIDALLRGRSVLMAGREPGDRPMQPSVFVDKLAAAGGIVWNEGWQISEEGRELLAVIKERES